MRLLTAMTCCIVALLCLPLSARAMPFRMLVNHGTGWSSAGDFATMRLCEQEAAAYATKHKAQAGCTPLSEALRWQNEMQFQQTANACAAEAGVEVVLKPGGQLTLLGTTRARFEFDRCMTARGQPVVGTR